MKYNICDIEKLIENLQKLKEEIIFLSACAESKQPIGENYDTYYKDTCRRLAEECIDFNDFVKVHIENKPL